MKDFRSQIQLIRQESKEHFKKPKVETPQLRSIENRVKNKSYSPSRKKETVRIDLSDEKKLAVNKFKPEKSNSLAKISFTDK